MPYQPIIEGMTPEDYMSALTVDFAGVLIEDVPTPVTDEMDGIEIQDAINDNFGKSDVLVGIRGSSFVNKINANFAAYGDISLAEPSDFAVVWTDDYAAITFTDNSGGTAQHEVWESKDERVYQLAYTIPIGVEFYNYYTWQNASLKFRIRAKQGTSYSLYSSVVSLVSPLVFKTDQSTLTPVVIAILQITYLKVININWGDGTNANYGGTTVSYTNITKNYSTQQNPYFIQISGDVDWITWIEHTQQSTSYGDLSKWNWKSTMKLNVFHWYSTNFTGKVIEGRSLPSEIGVFHVGNNELDDDLTDIIWPSLLYDLHLHENPFTGNTNCWVFPNTSKHICLWNTNLTGDWTDKIIPNACTWLNIEATDIWADVSNWVIPTDMCQMECRDLGLTGSFSNGVIADGLPVGLTQRQFQFSGNHLTVMPRGHFKYVSIFNFGTNSCDTAEIDSLLVYIDAYFTGEVVPLVNAVYTLNGVGMGIPSAAGLASRTSILGKYTAAGKTCTISVNS
jgi:hypothetical protein